MKNKILAVFATFAVIVACGRSGKKNTSENGSEEFQEYTMILPEKRVDTTKFTEITCALPDLSRDIDSMSLQELRLLRGTFYARRGYLFSEADLRAYFSAHMKSFDSLMFKSWEDRWENEETRDKPEKIKFSQKEQTLIDKIDEAMKRHLQQNFIERGDYRLANVQNVVNLFQFENVSQQFINMLAKNNFVIVPGENEQLFHLYEANDYKQIPNFITTDLFLQVFHMYFSYILKSLEQEKFIPILKELCLSLHTRSMEQAAAAESNFVKDLALYNAVFYAIPYYLLTGKKLNIPDEYRAKFEGEIARITALNDARSDFLSFDAGFPYSLFKPRGHYTRKPSTERYFRAMIWLQTAPYCRDNEQHLREAIFTALLLHTQKSVSSNTSLMKLYQSIFEPIAFLVGQPDNLSVMDIAAFLEREEIRTTEKALSAETVVRIDTILKDLAVHRNLIKPQIEMSCRDKINFMPQRYLIDNEVLQTMVDVTPDAQKSFPKGLDVFAAFGSESALEILYHEERENEKWDQYNEKISEMSRKFEKFGDWDASVYNKWIESLLTMQKKDKSYPPFMQTPAWNCKNLNTSLASWAELKHDAILYSEQPMAAECGGFGEPPAPITVGYVEPNLQFWMKLNELTILTEKMLTDHEVMTPGLKGRTNQLRDYGAFLEKITRKELNGERLSEQEYSTIEYLGSSLEHFTLSIVDPDRQPDAWSLVYGPDKSVAVTADIYTRNVPGCPKNGVLHVATGKVNDIYVVVEIEGYLYLTKGAVFSYYEFSMPAGQRLTDEEWQKTLEEKRQPDIPQWMKSLMIESDQNPRVDEKVFYSSGC